MRYNTTVTERLLEVSNKLWDAMYESGKVPTYSERAHYYLALKDVMDENAKLREELADAPKCEACEAMLDCDECLRADGSHKERRRLSTENAKLRELVQYILDEGYGDDWFGEKAEELGFKANY